MKKLLLVCMILSAFASLGQKYQFDYLGSENNELTENPTEHFLGEEIGDKMTLLKENYTYKEYNAVSQVETPKVDKPDIYFAVKKVNKHFKKLVKKGEVDRDEAFAHLDKVLTVALNIKTQNTDQVESDLKALKDPNEIIAFFEKEIEFLM